MADAELVLALIFLLGSPIIISAYVCNYKGIVSFGDSLADTGNALYLTKSDEQPPYYASLPYGETYFHNPTGRSSDGRLIIDFIAEELGLPLVEPYFGGNRSGNGLDGGVNFAVNGATVLEDSFFKAKGIEIDLRNVSLGAQIGWIKEYVSSMCLQLQLESSDCKALLGTSLVLAGEIGGNDYNYAFFQGKPLAQVRPYVPEVVRMIGRTINELVNLGALTIMVPGNFPIGCSAYYLTYFATWNEEEYDSETGCLKWLNKFAEYHNKLLQMEINRIQDLHPQATIIYADYYNAAMNLYRSPEKYGFKAGEGSLRACCGGGGPYNVNLTVKCGHANCCDDPSKYMSWDGLHLTEAAYKWIAKGLLENSYTMPSFSNICTLQPVASDIVGSYDH